MLCSDPRDRRGAAALQRRRSKCCAVLLRCRPACISALYGRPPPCLHKRAALRPACRRPATALLRCCNAAAVALLCQRIDAQRSRPGRLNPQCALFRRACLLPVPSAYLPCPSSSPCLSRPTCSAALPSPALPPALPMPPILLLAMAHPSPFALPLFCALQKGSSSAGSAAASVDAADIAAGAGAADGELGAAGGSAVDALLAANLTSLVEVAEVRGRVGRCAASQRRLFAGRREARVPRQHGAAHVSHCPARMSAAQQPCPCCCRFRTGDHRS